MITHSLGELDVLFPIFSKLYKKFHIEVELVFTVKYIYKKFIDNDFYQYFTEKYGIKSSLRNIYKYKKLSELSLLNKIIASIKNIGAFAIIFFRGILFIKNFLTYNYFMHEYTNQLTSTWSLYLFLNFFKKSKKIFVYIHGHAIQYDTPPAGNIKTNYADKVKALVFHKHSELYWNKRGFINQHIIGYPKFYPEWIELVKNYSSKKVIKKKFVLIYTRDIHPFYMDKDKYIELLTSSCKLINSKFKNLNIIIKPHPRENNNFINKTLHSENINNFIISNDTSLVFSSSCILAISFWTSAILDAICSKTPAIEYYIEAEKFREVEPRGSLYKDIGIISVNNKNDLEYYISNLDEVTKNNNFVLEKIRKSGDVNFL